MLGKRPGGGMIGRIIETDEDVAEGAAWLAAADPRFAAALSLTGPLPLRRRPDGFETLFSAIVSQQVSTASAIATWDRLAAIGATHAAGVLAATDESLRAAGLSRQKIAYGRAVAAPTLDFSALRTFSDTDVVAELIQIKGIGIWTAEIYAMSPSAARTSLRRGILRCRKRRGGSSGLGLGRRRECFVG